jgi:hypothetical protein
MSTTYTIVIEVAGLQLARSKPVRNQLIKPWIEQQKKQYREILSSRPWRIWLEVPSKMQNVKPTKSTAI